MPEIISALPVLEFSIFLRRWVLDFAGLALMPTYSLAILGVWAFGFAAGFPAARLGFAGGATIGYLTGRLASGDRVEKIIAENPKWHAIREALLGTQRDGGWWRTFVVVTLVRLPPNSPFAATNLVLSSLRVPLGIYVPATLAGMAPRTGLVLYIASTLKSSVLSKSETSPPLWLAVVGLVMSVAILVGLGKFAKYQLEKMTNAEKTAKQSPGAPVSQDPPTES
jgi:uncharacterized membrane protein YdjX (TVP38/TMEM64 family)